MQNSNPCIKRDRWPLLYTSLNAPRFSAWCYLNTAAHFESWSRRYGRPLPCRKLVKAFKEFNWAWLQTAKWLLCNRTVLIRKARPIIPSDDFTSWRDDYKCLGTEELLLWLALLHINILHICCCCSITFG